MLKEEIERINKLMILCGLAGLLLHMIKTKEDTDIEREPDNLMFRLNLIHHTRTRRHDAHT